MTDRTPPDTAVCPPAAFLVRQGEGGWLVRAPAKLNLTLRVGPLGPDGYHPLDSIVAKVTLYDELLIEPQSAGGVEFHCDAPSAGPPEQNLVVRAALALRERAGGAGARITLHKRIGVGAGLGGGSSDAAATLAALNQLWRLNLPHDHLAALAADLGSDVPLFLGPPASRMRGRGEIVEPVDLPDFWALLITPPVHCATGPVYKALDATAPGPLEPFDPAELLRRPVAQWDELLRNDLQVPAGRVCPEIGAWFERVANVVGQPVHMTGSGSALFVLAPDIQAALALHARLDAQTARHARVVARNPW